MITNCDDMLMIDHTHNQIVKRSYFKSNKMKRILISKAAIHSYELLVDYAVNDRWYSTQVEKSYI